MKKTLLALAVLAVTGSAFASGSSYSSPSKPPLGTVAVTGTGTNTVTSSVGSSSSVVGVGSASSTASNTQSALSWIAGSGSITSGSGSATLTLENCEPVNVKGTQLLGSVYSSGGIQVSGLSTANVTTTGTGTGAAQALGSSYASVSGLTTLTSTGTNPLMNLSAGGDAAGVVVTNTGVITSGSGLSQGSLAAGWNSSQTGSLLTFSDPKTGLTGDLKNITSTATTYVGGIPTLVGTGQCGDKACVTGSTVSIGGLTYVAGVANATTSGTVTNQLTLTNAVVTNPTTPTTTVAANNGLGNGDQTAPGASLPTNSAENGDTDPHAGSGKDVVKN